MTNEIIQILMDRDGMTKAEATEHFYDMCERAIDEDPEEILEEYGLEPDYIFEII